MNWSTREIRYLEENASDGAEAIAKALGRTTVSVQMQASRYGISLRRSWLCTKCGMRTRKPLSTKTGWCMTCTKAKRREHLAEEVRELEKEVVREKEEDRARQRLYVRKSRAKKKLEKTLRS